jgi:hypothetical protein
MLRLPALLSVDLLTPERFCHPEERFRFSGGLQWQPGRQQSAALTTHCGQHRANDADGSKEVNGEQPLDLFDRVRCLQGLRSRDQREPVKESNFGTESSSVEHSLEWRTPIPSMVIHLRTMGSWRIPRQNTMAAFALF